MNQAISFPQALRLIAGQLEDRRQLVAHIDLDGRRVMSLQVTRSGLVLADVDHAQEIEPPARRRAVAVG